MPQPKTDILRLPPIGSECFILDPPGFSFVVDSLHFARNVGAYVEGLMKDGISARYALADEGTIWTRTKPDSHPRCIATTAQLIEDNKTLSDRIATLETEKARLSRELEDRDIVVLASAASELGALADRLMGCRIPDRDGIIRCQIHRCRDFLTNISTRIITENHDGPSPR
jgi:hypothetical protein